MSQHDENYNDPTPPRERRQTRFTAADYRRYAYAPMHFQVDVLHQAFLQAAVQAEQIAKIQQALIAWQGFLPPQFLAAFRAIFDAPNRETEV